MKIHSPMIVLASFVFSLTVFAQSQSPKPNASCNTACTKKIQIILDDYRTKHHISGLQATLSFTNQTMQVFSSGSKTIDGKEPVDANTRFEIGSTTKSFTASIVLQLVREGKINLEDTVGKWLGDEYPAWRDNTVNHLLNMTSNTFDYFDNDGGMFEKIYWQNPTHIWTTKELTDWCYKNGPNCTRHNSQIHTPFCAEKPGQGWSYSNTNYILLERMIEKASGTSFTHLMRKRILAPLRLNTAIYDPERNPATIKNFAHAYHYSKDTNATEDVTHFSLSAARAAGAIIATTEDLAKWVRALFSGKVLGSPEFQRMTRVVCTQSTTDCQAGELAPKLGDRTGYSCGLMRIPAFTPNASPNDFVWVHTGGSAGHGSIFIYDVKNNFVLTAMQNQIGTGDFGPLVKEIDLALFSQEKKANQWSPTGKPVVPNDQPDYANRR